MTLDGYLLERYAEDTERLRTPGVRLSEPDREPLDSHRLLVTCWDTYACAETIVHTYRAVPEDHPMRVVLWRTLLILAQPYINHDGFDPAWTAELIDLFPSEES